MRVSLWATVVAVAVACGPSQASREKEAQAQQLQAENARLKQEIASLQTQLEDAQSTPGNLLVEAQKAFDGKDFAKSKDLADALIAKHPSSRQAAIARRIATSSGREVKKQELRAAREASKQSEPAQIGSLGSRSKNLDAVLAQLQPLFESYRVVGPVSVRMQLNADAWNSMTGDQQQQVGDMLASKAIVQETRNTLHLYVYETKVGEIGPGWSGEWKFRRSQ